MISLLNISNHYI